MLLPKEFLSNPELLITCEDAVEPELATDLYLKKYPSGKKFGFNRNQSPELVPWCLCLHKPKYRGETHKKGEVVYFSWQFWLGLMQADLIPRM